MEVKRFRLDGEVIEPEPESVSMANALMLLSRGDRQTSNNSSCTNSSNSSTSSTDQETQPSSPPVNRVFECKTCNRQFPSFQALGGHRASHKKPRLDGDSSPTKPKAHECSICGLEFAIGQALGGHMRRHRAAAEGFGGYAVVEKKACNGRRVMCFDLNLLPSENEAGQNLVECFH